MDDLLLHPETRTQLQSFLRHPSHALLLVSPDGSGKRTVAGVLAKQLLNLTSETDLASHTQLIFIQPKEQVIPIAAIRKLKSTMQLKTIGKHHTRRVVMIEDAHSMTTEAQNALLKVLEEPSLDSVFILTCHSVHSVLPTIYSRTQNLVLKSPPASEITHYFSNIGFKADKIEQAARYSGNRIGLMHALLNEDTEHPLLNAVQKAREVLSTSIFERLGLVEEWVSHKEEMPQRLDALTRICQAGVAAAAEKGNNTITQRWKQYYQAVYDASASLKRKPNTKLLLTDLFLRLR